MERKHAYLRGYDMELTKTTDTTSSNSPFNALTVMFYEPTKAFGMLEPRRHAWLPLLLIIVTTCVLMLWYFSMVDIPWLAQQMNAGIPDPAAREQAEKMLSKGVLMGGSLVGTVIGTPLITALIGVYFMLVAKAMSKDFTFGSGFALAAWSYVPGLLILPLGAIQILLASNNQISYSQLNPLSLNQIFFQYGMAHPLAAVLDAINFSTIWGIVLLVTGFQVWAKVSRATALKVVLIPYATIFGLWFAFALSKAA